MQLALGWLVAALAAGLVAWSLAARKLFISRDWFIIVYLADVFLHMHLFPMLYLGAPDFVAQGVSRPDNEVAWYYVLIQFAAVVLFELPLLWLYLRGTRRITAITRKPEFLDRLLPVPWKILAVSGVSVAFALTYLLVAMHYNVLRMPRDNAYIPYLLVGLPTPAYAVLRLFVYSGLFLASVLLVVVIHSRRLGGVIRFPAVIAFGLTAGVWLLQALLFSRWQVAFGTIVLTGVALSQRQREGRWSGIARRRQTLYIALVGIVCCAYLVRVTYNFRFCYIDAERVSWGLFNPLGSCGIPYFEDQDFRWRLNGVDLMARISPRAVSEGYALGAGWEYSFYASVGQWVSRRWAEEFKLNPLTDTKAYLEYRYTDYRMPDWPNSFLTDLYGNFSFPGFVLAAWTLSQVFVFVRRTLTVPRGFRWLLCGLFLISMTMMFENAFGPWLFGFLRPAPVLLVVLLLSPFRLRRQRLAAPECADDAT